MVDGQARRPIVAGNWKMNTTPATGVELARAVAALDLPHAAVDVVLCPPALGVTAVADAVRGTPIEVGVQNVHWEDAGAYTGEVAAGMAAGIAAYVLVGHSERRALFGETDAEVRRKVAGVLRHALTPIVMVGESLEQRDAGETQDQIQGQVAAALDGLTADSVAGLVIAYEPIWAIGTGRNATPAQAGEAIRWIRDAVRNGFGPAAADALRIQYGGSVNADNCVELLTDPDTDGALVGGASLDAAQFGAIVRAAAGSR